MKMVRGCFIKAELIVSFPEKMEKKKAAASIPVKGSEGVRTVVPESPNCKLTEKGSSRIRNLMPFAKLNQDTIMPLKIKITASDKSIQDDSYFTSKKEDTTRNKVLRIKKLY